MRCKEVDCIYNGRVVDADGFGICYEDYVDETTIECPGACVVDNDEYRELAGVERKEVTIETQEE